MHVVCAFAWQVHEPAEFNALWLLMRLPLVLLHGPQELP